MEVAQSVPDVSGAERVEAFAAIEAEAVSFDDASLPSEAEAASGHLDSVALLEQEALLQLLPS